MGNRQKKKIIALVRVVSARLFPTLYSKQIRFVLQIVEFVSPILSSL